MQSQYLQDKLAIKKTNKQRLYLKPNLPAASIAALSMNLKQYSCARRHWQTLCQYRPYYVVLTVRIL